MRFTVPELYLFVEILDRPRPGDGYVWNQAPI